MFVPLLLAGLTLPSAGSIPAPDFANLPAEHVCSSPTLRRARNGSVEIAYRTVGKRSGKPLLLVPGSGMQLVDWPEALLTGLIRAGYFLIMPDPRDAGCSTKLDDLGAPDWPRLLGDMSAGRRASPGYAVDDMVADMIAVLDAEGLGSVHVLGASGGSIVAEVMAVERPKRVRSLTLLMANAGNPARPVPAKPQVLASVMPLTPGGDAVAVEAYLANLERALTGSAAPAQIVLLQRARMRIARGYSADGVQRQGAAFLAAGDLRGKLATVSVPATVIHGAEDPLLPVDAGRDVAQAIRGASLRVVPRSGHALDDDMVAAALDALRAPKPSTGRR